MTVELEVVSDNLNGTTAVTSDTAVHRPVTVYVVTEIQRVCSKRHIQYG